MRVGNGFDIHRLVLGCPLRLGGITIPSEKGSLGHSDGDALIHAIIDALLGACAIGDIGKLFPDSDPAYKDINSEVLLEIVMERLGVDIINVDSTIILQEPRIGKFTDPIRENLAKLLGIDVSCISVKAKTAEHMLGELGTGDAVVAQVVVLVQ